MLADDAALARLPPMYSITAEFDPLRDEAEAFASRLASLGVPTKLHRINGCVPGGRVRLCVPFVDCPALPGLCV
jgi:acetyl esterase/lipase